MFKNKEKLNYLNFRLNNAEEHIKQELNSIMLLNFDEFRKKETQIKLSELTGMQMMLNYVCKWLNDNPKDYRKK